MPLTGFEISTEREIKRINEQIKQTAKIFGKQSSQYSYYESMLTKLDGGKFARFNKQGVVQISRTKTAVSQLTEKGTTEQRALTKLSKQKTVKEQLQKAQERYTKRTGVTLKTAKEKKAAQYEQIAYEKNIQEELDSTLKEYYKHLSENGQGLTETQIQLRSISKGKRTKNEDLQTMINIAKEAIKQEDYEITNNYLGGV